MCLLENIIVFNSFHNYNPIYSPGFTFVCIRPFCRVNTIQIQEFHENALFFVSLQVIAVVMDNFTDADIFRDLLDAGYKRKVSVYILLERTSLPHFLSMCQRTKMHDGHLKVSYRHTLAPVKTNNVGSFSENGSQSLCSRPGRVTGSCKVILRNRQ